MDLSHIFDMTAKASLLLVLALLSASALRRRPASLRHLVWGLALLGTLALPVLELALPKVEIVPLAAPREEAPSGPLVADRFTPRPLVEAGPNRFQSYERSGQVSRSIQENPPATQQSEPGSNRNTAIGREGSTIALAVWLAVASALILYWLSRLLFIQRIGRKTLSGRSSLDLELLLPVLRRRVAFFVSCGSVPAVPLTWGLFRPNVLLPKSAEDWPPNHTEAVLAHEIAHVRRCDSLWQGIAFFACALYWFNPAMWLAARAMRAEAELAADDSVLESGVDPSEYASTLVTVAAAASGRHLRIPLAGVAFMNPNKLERRIDAILDPLRSRRGGATMVGLIVPSAVAAICFLSVLGFGRTGKKLAQKADGQEQTNPPLQDSTANLKSNWWKIVLTQNGKKTLIFVYQKGTELMGYETSKTRNSASSGSQGGSTEALDTWKIDRFENLSDGQPIEPFRVIKPEYRKLLAQNGIPVSASSVEEVKSNFPMGVPPDADEERAEFIHRHYGSGADQILGPAVFYKGNVIGIVRTSVRKEAQSKGWHWPDVDASTAARQPTGYWKVEFPYPGMPTTYIFHMVGSSVEMTSLVAASELAQPVNGKDPVVGGLVQIVSAWHLETQTQTWPNGGNIGVNDVTLRPQYLDDPAYRERMKPTVVRIEPVTRAEAEEFASVRFTPLLERTLASVENDVAEERIHPIAQAPWHTRHSEVQLSNNRPTGIHGEIVVGGRKSQTWLATPQGSTQTPFDAKTTMDLMAAADAELSALAKDWANASVAYNQEKARAGKGGSQALFDAEDQLQKVQQKISNATMAYGSPPNSGLFFLPEGSSEFFKERADKLIVYWKDLDRKSEEADTLFKQGKISDFDKELAEDLAAIEHFKVRSLERRIRMADRQPSRSGSFGSETQQRINRIELEPVSLDAKDEDVRPLLEKLFNDQAVPLVLDPRVRGHVTISAKTAPGGAVLREILKQVGAKSVIDDGTYHIVPGP